ncbi:MAG: PAS domain S-box protein [Bacteroidetes bacterium]|nr:PAS domain S-box protein [Bacteroidota bacterium]
MKNEVDSHTEDILIVDDLETNIKFLTTKLNNVGYHVRTASNGEMALQCVQTKLPALILLDIIMPGFDGFEVCKRLKADNRTCDIPVIFITAVNDNSSKIEGFRLGAVDYITKPFIIEEVISRISVHFKLRLTQIELKNQNTKLLNEIAERIRLGESLYLNQFAIDHMSDAAYWATPDGKIKYVNDAACRLHDYTREEMLQMSISDIAVSDRAQKWTDFSKRLKDEGMMSFESFHKTRTGKLVPVEVHVNYLTFGGNEYNCGFVHDITERKKAEESLRETKNYLESLFDYANAPIIVWDNNLEITKFNKAFELLSGRKESDILGQKVEILFPSATREQSIEYIKKASTGERWEVVEIDILHVDGTVNTLLWNSAAIYSANSKNIIATIAQGQSITKRKQAERALRESEKQLRELNATKDKFFSIIAHDLKSPFNSIIGFSNLLAEQMKEKNYEGTEKYAEIIQHSAMKALDLLLNLLEWSRSQTGRMEFHPEFCELVSNIKEVTELLNDAAHQKSITISRHLPHNLPIFADTAMISTILRNLISNAIKFTPSGGTIDIYATSDRNNVEIKVSDNGVGMDEKIINRLFKIEENITSTGTANEKGTGLGLILCHEFVEKHGGKIWVESKPGKGSTFYFTLPMRRYDEVNFL